MGFVSMKMARDSSAASSLERRCASSQTISPNNQGMQLSRYGPILRKVADRQRSTRACLVATLPELLCLSGHASR